MSIRSGTAAGKKRPLLELLSEVSAEALPQFAITVHGIKSASRGIGADALGSLAEALELAAKASNSQSKLRFTRSPAGRRSPATGEAAETALAGQKSHFLPGCEP